VKPSEVGVSGVGFWSVEGVGGFADGAGEIEGCGTTTDVRLLGVGLEPAVQLAVTVRPVGIVAMGVGQSTICRTIRVTTRSNGNSVGITNVPITRGKT
jgi:hypothetical protein